MVLLNLMRYKHDDVVCLEMVLSNIVYLYCNEIIEEFDYLENCSENNDREPMDIDNYYSDQEYWFEGDD